MRASERARRSDFLASSRLQWAMLRDLGLRRSLRLNLEMAKALIASQRVLRDGYYDLISEGELRSLKTSRRAFVYGSGFSLNTIQPDEWRRMSEDTTIGFNTTVYQDWVRVDFHLVRGWGVGSAPSALRDLAHDFGNDVRRNPRYRETVFVFQDDYTALFAHRLLGYRTLPEGIRVFPYRTNRTSCLPSDALSDGLVHAVGTLCDAVNFASCLGFEEIVLVGVDLYDSRYFFVERDRTAATDYETGKLVVGVTSYRGQRVDDPHSTVTNGIIDVMAAWYQHLKRKDISLSVHNPKSLLAEVMPTYAQRKHA